MGGVGCVEQGWQREETGKGDKAKLLPRTLAFIKVFYGLCAKHTGFSFNPHNIPRRNVVCWYITWLPLVY